MSWGSHSYGAAAYGGQPATVVGVVVPYGLDLQLTIGNVDYTDYLRNDTLSINDELGSRIVCDFQLIDSQRELFPDIGQEVNITYAGSVIFRGTIDEFERADVADPYFSDTLQITIRAVDWHQLCDRHIVAQRYSVLGQPLVNQDGVMPYGVVNQIVSTDSGDSNERLSDEGITVNYDSSVEYPVLETISFNYETVTDCFDQLAELTGYTWRINFDKVLSFYDPANNPAPYILDPSIWAEYRGLRVRRTREKYRNVQYLRGGTGTTGTRVQTFTGDSENQSFELLLPVAEKPSLTAAGSPVSAAYVGIRTDDDQRTDLKWFYEIGSKTISQNSNETPLSGAQTLVVTYIGQIKIATVGRNDAEITARKAVEGSGGSATGVYVHVESDEKLDDVDLTDKKVSELLRRFGRIPDFVEFETDVDGFRAGQLLTVNLADHRVSGTFLIDSVTFECVADKFFRYRIRAIEGEGDGGWIEFFKAWISKGRPFIIRENETIRTLRHGFDTVVIGDSISFTTSLRSATTDYYTTIIVGLSGVGGSRRALWQGSTSPDAGDTGGYSGPLLGAYTSP